MSSGAADKVPPGMVADLDSPARIGQFVSLLYERLLRDEMLAPLFIDVAEIDLNEHLPRICQYWEKMLLGRPGYNGHTMMLHRAVHRRRAFNDATFARWLQHFEATLDSAFAGVYTERARLLAHRVAQNMRDSLDAATSTRESAR